MGIRPNFENPVQILGPDLRVAGTSDGDPLPVATQVFLEQDGQVAGAAVDTPGTSWRTTLPSEGFHAGPALAFGVEIRTGPFEATSWSQMVEIR